MRNETILIVTFGALLFLALVSIFFWVGDSNDNTIMHNPDKEWCVAQQDSIIINGHFTNLTHTKSKQVVEECCCFGSDEFVCICREDVENMNLKLFSQDEEKR